MSTDTLVGDLERRKQVRLRVRADLDITPQKYEGRTYYVVKDPVSLRYYRFKEHEQFLLRLMDGTHTLDQTQKEFEKCFRPERLTLEDLEQFGQQLLTAGLAQNEAPQAGQQLFDRRAKRRRMELLQMFTNILYIKLPIIDPDKLLTRMLPYGRWLFTTGFLLVSIAVMLGAVLLVLTHFQTFRDRLPSYQEFFSFKTVIYLWAALGAVKVIHEFGHGLSCKAFGGEVHEMGFLILCFSPCMYCNVSDAWTLPNKWQRIIISGAGIYVELMIAALATFVWWNSTSYPFVNYMSLCLVIVCSVSTVLFNGNPLMRYDGYYVLADWMEIPNLRERSNRYLQRVVMEHCLGIEVQPEPYMEMWRRLLFISYAVVSWVYRWVITFVILQFMATFLKPYKLEVISTLLALFALGSMLGWPLYRLGKNLHKRGRLPDMKPVRVLISSAAVAALLLVFFFLPLPVSRVRESGVVQVQPSDSVQVHMETTAILEAMHVREGQLVKKGKILATFKSRELASKKEDTESQYYIKSKLVGASEARLNAVRDLRERLELQKTRATAEGERDQLLSKLKEIQQEMERLTLRAARDGVVMGLPQVDEIGKQWDTDQPTPFCTIGDPRKLRVLVPVTPADFELIRDNLHEFAAQGRQLGVTIRVHGHVAMTWAGGVSPQLPESEAKEVPFALTNKAGGPLPTKPSQNPNLFVPQSQVYLIGVDFLEPAPSVAPGALAQIKIHCGHRSCGWWVWRFLSSTFDIGLL